MNTSATAVRSRQLSPQRPSQAKFRPDIQGLRAVAVLLVALNHAGVGWLPGGYVGVDIFFVISGFLITQILVRDARKGSVNFGQFYARRAKRILPASALVIVVTSLVSVNLMNFVNARKVLDDGIWASLFAANLHFSHEGTNYFVHTATSPLQHYWSLAVEEQFYLVWPLVIALTLVVLHIRQQRHRGRHARPTVGVGWTVVPLAGIFVASLTLSVLQTTPTATSPYFSTIDRAWELAAGALLALGAPLIARLPAGARIAAAWLGAAAIAIAASTFSASTPFPGSAALLPVLGACAIIGGGLPTDASGSNRMVGFNRILWMRPLQYVGNVSYSFYLWHFPALILGAAWAGHTLSTIANVGLLVLAFGIAVVSFRLVEDPIRRSQRLWAHRSRRPLVMWPASFALVAIVVVASGRRVLRAGPRRSCRLDHLRL